jgi:hypothetical protein
MGHAFRHIAIRRARNERSLKEISWKAPFTQETEIFPVDPPGAAANVPATEKEPLVVLNIVVLVGKWRMGR